MTELRNRAVALTKQLFPPLVQNVDLKIIRIIFLLSLEWNRKEIIILVFSNNRETSKSSLQYRSVNTYTTMAFG